MLCMEECIMNYIKFFVKYLRSGHRCNGEMYIKHLKKRGMRIGEGTTLFNPETTLIDETTPYMISIGKNVQITGGVTILSHDYGWSVLKANYGDILGSIRPVTIGDNVYIGMNTIVLGGGKDRKQCYSWSKFTCI